MMGIGGIRAFSAAVLLLAFSWNPLSPQAIQGHLVDAQTGDPIILGEVILLLGSGEIVDRTFADEAGYFIVTSEAPGNFFLRAERMGYEARVDGIFELGEGGLLTVEFRLPKAPVLLDTLTVEVERRDFKLSLLGFYDRREIGLGKFIGPEEMPRSGSGKILHRVLRERHSGNGPE